jgi:AbrB family looped-hinge helix DNA binding protein
MTSTIDRLGRLVIPKKIRDRLQLGPGAEVEIEEQDGVIHIRPATAPVTIKETKHGPVAEPDEPMPVLTDDMVRETLDRVRR